MSDVILVGLPGSGKTTAGRAVAEALQRSFVDTDDVFFELEHVSVQEYLRSFGEPKFRERELLALRHALVNYDVVATGGGVVTTSEARALLSSELTVWLDCSDDVLVERVRGGDRPLLAGDVATRMRELREQRGALYAVVSRSRVDTAGPLDDVTTELRGVIENAQTPS
ncbi:MAG TPA: shikimate kinase [Acidimicrobiales bacterium]